MRNLFYYDNLHDRVDINRTLSYAILGLTVFVWSLLGNPTLKQYINRLIIGGVFIVMARLLLVRLGASRLSAALVAATSFILIGGLSPRQLADVGAFAGLLLVCLEFSKMRTKVAALASGVLVGLLAIGEGGQATAILLLFGIFVASRFVWHSMVEKISKVELVLFLAKIIIAFALAFSIYELGKDAYAFPWAHVGYVALPHVPWLLALVAALVMARGLWATLLLQTERSPKGRGIRMFLLFLGVALILIVGWLTSYGTDVFTANFLAHFVHAGFTQYALQTSIFAIYAGMLLADAGISRSLYRTTDIARAIQKRIQ